MPDRAVAPLTLELDAGAPIALGSSVDVAPGFLRKLYESDCVDPSVRPPSDGRKRNSGKGSTRGELSVVVEKGVKEFGSGLSDSNPRRDDVGRER